MAITLKLAVALECGRTPAAGSTSPSSRPRRSTTASTPSAWRCSCPGRSTPASAPATSARWSTGCAAGCGCSSTPASTGSSGSGRTSRWPTETPTGDLPVRADLRGPRGRAPGVVHRDATDHVGAARALLLARRDDAGAHADEAARRLARWEGWRVDALEALERRLGRRGAEATDGPVELTRREREVLALVAEGLTNAELRRTALHLAPHRRRPRSNILAKLGMSSRTRGGGVGRPLRSRCLTASRTAQTASSPNRRRERAPEVV